MDVSQDMRQTLLYVLYPLSHVQWDRCVQDSHYLLTYKESEHYLYRGK